jgi:hypothetical protein
MNDKSLERVLEYILNDMNEVFILLTKKIEELEQDLIELEKHREESIKLAYKKGYEDGSKYTNKIWQRRISILKNYHEGV